MALSFQRWLRVPCCFAFVLLLADVARSDPSGSDWRLVFADEFSGTSIDPVKWATQYEWGRTHNHDAYMLDSNVLVNGGTVKLRATRETTQGMPFSSGVIASYDTFRMDSGYIEARVKMPTRQGSWPAFWMLDGAWPPEIDIFEYPVFTGTNIPDRYSESSIWLGSNGQPQSDFTWIGDGSPAGEIDLPNLSLDYHNYALQWDSTGLKFYFDGTLVKTSAL